MQYVGETTTTFNTRLRGHISDINTSKIDKPVSKHFNNGTCQVDDVTATIIDSINVRDVNTLLRLEEAWIRLLQTADPKGINLQL